MPKGGLTTPQTNRIGHTLRWALLLVIALTMVGPNKLMQMEVKGLVLGEILSSG